MLKKLLVNSAVFGFSQHIPKIIGILILPIITKYLTDVDYGIAGTIAAYTGAIAVFSTLGLNVVLTNSFFHSKYQYKWLWRQLYGFLQGWMIVFAVLQSILLYFVIPEEAKDNRIAIIILTNLSTVLFGATSLIGSTHYILKQEVIPVAIRNIISGFITIFCNILFVVHFRMGYMGWYASSLIASIFINASYWWVVNKKWKMSPIFRFKRRTIKKYLKIALPTIPHYYSGFLLNSSSRLIMDKANISMNNIGRFNMAQSFGTYFDIFSSALNTAINPMIMEQIRNDNEKIAQKLIFFMQFIILTSSFVFCLWAKEIFHFLIKNKELSQTYPIAIILIMAINYRPMYVATSNIFFYYEKTKDLLKITLAAGVLSFILYLIVIPIWGIMGAAIVNYISLMYMGFSGFFMKIFKTKTKVDYPFIRVFIIINLLTVIVYFLVEIDWLLKLIIMFVLFVSFIFVLKRYSIIKRMSLNK